MKNLRQIATDIARAEIRSCYDDKNKVLEVMFKVIAQNNDMRLVPTHRYILSEEEWYEPTADGIWWHCGTTYVLFDTTNGNYYFAHDINPDAIGKYVVTY